MHINLLLNIALHGVLVPEILQLDEATIQSFIDSNNDLKRYEFDLKLINEKRPYIRCEYRKVINRSTRRTFNASVYGMFSNADLEFEDAIDKKMVKLIL